MIRLLCLLTALALVFAQRPGEKPAAAAASEEAYRANNLGVAYLEQYNYEPAANSFREALKRDGTLTLARINLSIALLYLADLTGADREARAALDRQPDALQAHYVLGLVARQENRADDGIASFRRVLAADPRDVGALVNLGQLLMQRREYAEAAALFRTAVEAEPYHVTATYNLAVALTRSGKTDEGQQMTAQFQKLRESGYGTTFSNNYLEQGRYAEALVSTGAEPELVSTATPDVRFVETKAIAAASPGGGAHSGFSGGVTLADLDRDDDLDIVDVSSGALHVFLNDRGQFTDATAKLGLAPAASTPGGVALSAIVGDYDNDERPDIFVLGFGAHALYRQMEDGRFEDRTAAAKIPPADVMRRAGAFVDVDHDGDLDLFLAGGIRVSADDAKKLLNEDSEGGGAEARPATPNLLLRNNGDGTFADVTADAKVGEPSMHAMAVAPTDYDNRRDLDMIVAGMGHAPVLFRNMRDGTFQDAAQAAGLPAEARLTSIATGDVNKDGFTDVFFGRVGAAGTLMLNDRGVTFRAAQQAPAAANVLGSQFLDYDNDGLIDLVTVGRGGVSIWRNLGRAWADVTEAAAKDVNATFGAGGGGAGAGASGAAAGARRLIGFAAGDLDRDGDLDLVLKGRGGELIVLDNQNGNRQASLRVRLTGRASNRSGIGSKVEIRAGSLWQRLELTSATPAANPADVLFGLGGRASADVVRILWPAGIVQAEPLAAAPGAAPGAASAKVVAFTELDRKPSSCPYLYTWNGERFEFITDFMGGGEMGYWHAPGVRNVPDPVEYTRIREDQLRPRDGRYELRVTNELEETLFVDRVQLIAISHPSSVEIHPREGLFEPPFPRFDLYAARDVHPAPRVLDHDGRDVTDRARARDRQFIEGFPLERIRGYARPHTLTIDMSAGAGSSPDLLLLTGWTDYAFSSDNVAASHAGLQMEGPSLAVQDKDGHWQTVVKEVGIPVGRPQTVVVDVTGKWLSPSRQVQLRTSMRIYWDQIQVATRDVTLSRALTASGRRERAAVSSSSASVSRATATDVVPSLVRLDPISADLHWRGFSAEATTEEPFTYDYARVSATSPWKLMPGRYTREGDVRPLLRTTDDMFVVSRPGDEIALSFDATALPPLPTGRTRTFLLYSDGFSKEMDLHSASPDQAWPLPFHTMTRYPYASPERYPLTAARRAYIDRYNTRIVSRPLPPLELQTAASPHTSSR